jgi:hypothetical protein
MKKKNLNKLSLNRKAISNLDSDASKGGTATPVPPTAVSLRPIHCATQNNGCASSVHIWCNVSCYIC